MSDSCKSINSIVPESLCRQAYETEQHSVSYATNIVNHVFTNNVSTFHWCFLKLLLALLFCSCYCINCE